MLTVTGNRLICVDVDDTLVFLEAPGPKVKSVLVPFQKEMIRVWPNQKLIKKLRIQREQGKVLWCWSQQGSEWVEAVVSTLGLHELFHLGSVKPELAIDDLPAATWLRVEKP